MADSPPNPESVSDPPDAAPPTPPRRRRWLRRLGWGLLTTALVVAVGLLLVTRPFVLTPLMSWQLSNALGSRVVVERATWRWPGGVTLHGVVVDLAADPASSRPDVDAYARLLEVGRIDATLDGAALRSGKLQLSTLAIDTPMLSIVEDADQGTVNLTQWLFPAAAGDGSTGALALPKEISLENAGIRFERITDGNRHELATMRISGSLTPDPQTGVQTFVVEQTNAGDNEPLRVTGMIDPQTPRIEVSVDEFDFTRPVGVLVPSSFREVWTELNPQGEFPTLRAVFVGTDGQGLMLKEAELLLHDLAVTLPLDALGFGERMQDTGPETSVESEMPDVPHQIRMTDVRGRFVMQDDVLKVDALRGMIEGVRYTIGGYQALDGQGAMRLSFSTDPFDLDANPPFILRLPGAVRKIYAEYQPQGRFRAEAIIQRGSYDEPVQYEGHVELLGAAGAFHKFPFPLEGLRGMVTFNDDGLTLDNLRATGPAGGDITIRGWVNDPGPDAKADVIIDIDAVPLDDTLLGALDEDAQQSIRMFFHEPAYARLRDAGLLDGPGEGRGGRDLTPALFTLGGEIYGRVHIERDLSVGPKSRVTTRLDAAGLGTVFKYWPYPMVAQSGGIEVTDQKITVDRLVLRGPTGATGVVHGTLERPGGGAPIVPDLAIDDIQVPTDAFLAASLPEDEAVWLRRTGVDGLLRGRGRVTAGDATDPVAYRIDGRIEDATLRPHGGGFVIEDVSGALRLERNLLLLDDVRGRRGKAVLTVSGRIDAAAEPNRFELTGRATNLAVEPALADLLKDDPEAHAGVETLFTAYRPGGTTDAQVRIARAATDDPTLKIELTLEPKALSFDYADARITVDDMTGRALLYPDHAALESVQGVLQDHDTALGWVRLDGSVSYRGDSDTALSVSAASTMACPATRALLPEAAVAAIDALALDGGYTLESGRALWRAEPGDNPAREFDAVVHLHDATAQLGVTISELNGTLDASVRGFANRDLPSLRLSFDVSQLRAAERRIAPLHATLSNEANPGWLALEDVAGRLYGGTLTARGGLPLTGTGRYQIDLALHDAAVGPFLDPASETAPAPEGKDEPEDTGQEAEDVALDAEAFERKMETGVVSASLAIEADLADAMSRIGRGEMVMRDAKIFERNFGIALLRTLNFGLPSDAPLDRATARFLLDADTVRFDELLLAGPGLEIRGTGTMTYPATELDLALFTRNQAAPNLGPISDLINALKDEFIAIRVTGTLAQPVSRVVSLSGVKSSWEQVFGRTLAPLDKDQRNAEANTAE